MSDPAGMVLLFLGAIFAFIAVVVLKIFVSGTIRRWRLCGSLWRALTEAHVSSPLAVYDVRVFGNRAASLKVFLPDDGDGLIFEIRPKGFLSYARHELRVAGEDLAALARMLKA